MRNKTIFDFTDDPVILEELAGTTDKETFLKGLAPEGPMFSLIDYAEYVQDKKMLEILEKEFEFELSAFFSE